MDIDPDIRRQLYQQARLWSLSLVCATVGALVIWRSGRLAPGILAFLVALALLGPVLWAYERRARARRRS